MHTQTLDIKPAKPLFPYEIFTYLVTGSATFKIP